MFGIAYGFIGAFLVSSILGGYVLKALQRIGVKQTVSEDAPSRHLEKQGTPTMGGLLILLGLTLTLLLRAIVEPSYRAGMTLLGLTIANGLIGFLDDYLIVKRGKNLGLKAREKLALQFVFAI